jgi:hypothetical protein
MKQLCTLMDVTNYISLHKKNYFFLPNEKIALIDTESTYDRSAMFRGYMRLLRADINKYYDEDALKYILDKTIRVVRHSSKNAHLLMNHLQAMAKDAPWDYVSYAKKQLH